MHDIQDELNQVPEAILGHKDCDTCSRSLPVSCFKRDGTFRDGRWPQCDQCASCPDLPLVEHTQRLRERNLRSEAVKAQRRPHQEDYRDDAARVGRIMHHSELLYRLRKLVPSLYITEGGIQGDLSVYRTFGQIQPSGKDFEYVCFIPTGFLKEYSTYEFNERNVLVREKIEGGRGWRTILLKLIKNGVVTEDAVNREFGKPVGPASVVWRRTLYSYRNQVNTDRDAT